MDSNRGFNSLYLYCDSAEAIPDITAPLLRVVDAAGNFGDLIHWLYTTPHYVPVSRTEFNTMEIDIKNDFERSVPFEFDKTNYHYTFAEAGIRISYNNEKTVLLRS